MATETCSAPYDNRERSVRCRERHCRARVGVACNGVGASGGYSHPVRMADGYAARQAS